MSIILSIMADVAFMMLVIFVAVLAALFAEGMCGGPDPWEVAKSNQIKEPKDWDDF